MRTVILTLLIASSLLPGNSTRDSDVRDLGRWVTLGTLAGPIPDPQRSQPANVLLFYDKAYLVDAGDGAASQLARAGVSLHDIEAVFISHVHFDHTGGLSAILGLRMQLSAQNNLTVYGPPGIREMVDGLLQFMTPFAQVGTGAPGQRPRKPGANIAVVELVDGATVHIGAITVKAVRNTHYSFEKGSREYELYQSLAFRFDLPNRSIVYTGDTGPSESVEQLAKGAELLISEVMDVDKAVERVRAENSLMPAPILEKVSKHLRAHHISPEQVGEMATRANVGAVVLTHLSPPMHSEEEQRYYEELVGKTFNGDVTVANDLDSF